MQEWLRKHWVRFILARRSAEYPLASFGMIPPSTVLIIYGVMTQESIGKLFIAGIVPGLLVAALMSITILIVVWRKPSLAPMSQAFSFGEKLRSLSGVIEMLFLFALVMGGLFVGWFTPTEAGGIGAAGALMIAVARRKLKPRALWVALAETTRISAMVFMILAGATIFGHFMAITRAPFALSEWVGALPLPPLVVMVLVLCVYLVGGCFMDSLALITLTIPILYPIVLQLGYDSVWFGVMMVLVAEMGVITPPVGINVYVTKGRGPGSAPAHHIPGHDTVLAGIGRGRYSHSAFAPDSPFLADLGHQMTMLWRRELKRVRRAEPTAAVVGTTWSNSRLRGLEVE